MPLSLSISNISPAPRESISLAAALMSSLGEPRLHLDAMLAGLRPRELDRSARRDLASMLKRNGVGATGIDLFLPPQHLAETAHVDRAVGAITSAIELLAELASLGALESKVLCLSLPQKPLANALAAIGSAAQERGVTVTDFSLPAASEVPASIARGVDCAQAIAAGQDPASLIASSAPGAIRLCDWDGTRRVPVGTGRLEPRLLVASASIAAPSVPVVIDLRGIDGLGSNAQAWESATRQAVKTWQAGLAGT
ncbi:MAG: hypothetical protein JNK16_08585 [Phycisphaerales bacterium]|nr:hypothetical protein [Phycisphaerales bacterium]